MIFVPGICCIPTGARFLHPDSASPKPLRKLAKVKNKAATLQVGCPGQEVIGSMGYFTYLYMEYIGVIYNPLILTVDTNFLGHPSRRSSGHFGKTPNKKSSKYFLSPDIFLGNYRI